MTTIHLSHASLTLAISALITVHACRGVPSMIERNEASAAQPVSLHLGEPLHITLAETASTGYTWRITTPCATILKPAEEHSGAAGTLPGAPRQRTWTFVASTPGTCALTFQSARTWEATATGKSVSFAVTVEP